ncbi:hypothetical protein [Pseudomonas sp. AN3A02]|jgi:hypothetical protein|uniref:hypothetical protein n=1 Tax=Pseudomonas sp. AN3A02 TaxID=2719587 RepID=UPI0014312DA5|nr:hypothetical protein [Pseudomonas sp. AN3A02]NIL16790.1 hypothetical protein [Pseudomonas sp. AN3A02]
MAEYGLNVFDEHGVKTLGMEDFTIKRLASQVIPAITTGGGGFKYNYDTTMDVPGYDPANCFVIITPRKYAGYDQTISDNWPVLPTYVDLGGTKIGLRTWLNYGVYDGHRFKYYWYAKTVECVVEVVRVA